VRYVKKIILHISHNKICSKFVCSSAPLNHNEQEIAGYRDALNAIHNGFENIVIDTQSILNLHSVLLSYTEIGGGNYKPSDNLILEIDRDGNRKIRFTPTKAIETQSAINSKKISKRERIEQTILNSLLPLGKQEINYILPDVSATTIEIVVSQMLKQSKIKKIGTFKNAKYIKN